VASIAVCPFSDFRLVIRPGLMLAMVWSPGNHDRVARCRRSARVGERCAASLNSQRQAGIECDRKFSWARQQCHVRAIFLQQGNAFAVLVRVEHCHSAGERNFAHAFAENFSLQFHRAATRRRFNVQFHVGMFDGVGKRRDVGFLRRLAASSISRLYSSSVSVTLPESGKGSADFSSVPQPDRRAQTETQ
jgi:hypothetical protein